MNSRCLVTKVEDGRDGLAGSSYVTFGETSVCRGMFEALESKGIVVRPSCRGSPHRRTDLAKYWPTILELGHN